MTDNWVVSSDGSAAVVSGRIKIPLLKKLNPFWWFGNEAEQTLDQAPWYVPTYPQWLRVLLWNLRNPLQNFRSFVIGIQDRNYTVIGKAPVLTVQRNDLNPPERGWQWCRIHTKIPLGFISYSGRRFVWYAGWQPTGFFGFKFNFVGNP